MATMQLDRSRPILGISRERITVFTLLLARVAGYVSVFGLWLYLSKSVFDPITLPPPSKVFDAMREIIDDNLLWTNFQYSMTTFLITFTLAFLIGTFIGMLMGRSRYFDAFFRDYILASLTTPGLVFIFVGIMLFGIGPSGRILPVTLIVIPLVVINVVEGVQAIPRDLFDMANAYRVTGVRQVRHILLPGIAPFLFTAARYAIAVGLRVSALIEVFGGTRGMGFQLRRNFERYDVAGAMAWTLFIVIFVLIVERIILKRAEKIFFKWRPEAFTS